VRTSIYNFKKGKKLSSYSGIVVILNI